MDVRYHAGGYDAQTVVPFSSITMLMEFQGMDVILPAGHALEIVLTQSGEDYLPPACANACPITVNDGLTLPTPIGTAQRPHHAPGRRCRQQPVIPRRNPVHPANLPWWFMHLREKNNRNRANGGFCERPVKIEIV